MSFTIFYNEKTPFQAIKTTSSKRGKIHIFPKGLTHGFGRKWPFFQLSFLANIGHENVFHDILQRKNAFLGYKNNKFKKGKNSHFSKGVNPWFWPESGYFSNFCLLGNIGHKNVFHDILQRKNAFLGYKNNKFKKGKNSHFSKGVNPWFWSKMAIFPAFFFSQYRTRKCLSRYSTTRKRLSRL